MHDNGPILIAYDGSASADHASRGRRGVKSLLLGSVFHHVLHHARRPALVIPSPSPAEARQRLANVNGEAVSLAG